MKYQKNWVDPPAKAGRYKRNIKQLSDFGILVRSPVFPAQ
jgi:hypothetical protein